MSVRQISVFLESRPGHLSRVLEQFELVGVNVRGYSAADTGDYGIVRFIVDNPDRALEVLHEMGAACTSSDVLVLRLDDKPGELARLMSVITRCNINVAYSYSLITTYIALSVPNPENVEALLRAEPVDLISQSDLEKPFVTPSEG